jgi:hypothetical protein
MFYFLTALATVPAMIVMLYLLRRYGPSRKASALA